jgi:hypothetical protein
MPNFMAVLTDTVSMAAAEQSRTNPAIHNVDALDSLAFSELSA